MINLDTEITYLKGVGPKKAELFSRLGVGTIRDLLYLFPRKYEDWQVVYTIREAPEDENVCLRGIVCYDASTRRISGDRIIVKSAITDGGGSMDLVFFNNKFIADRLKEGNDILVYGKITLDQTGHRQMISPQVAESSNPPIMKPIYPLTAGLNSNTVAKAVRTALDLIKPFLEETLPEYLIQKYRLMGLFDSIEQLHFPKSGEQIRLARRRLVFEELLILELGMIRLKYGRTINSNIILKENYIEEFIQSLPFSLTNAQRRCVEEARLDMAGGRMMNRLLQGDVGSGKTAVAACLIYNVIRHGYRAALMAPTEVLASQHYATFRKFFDGFGINVALLTGATSQKDKKIIKEALKNGEIQLIIGTHALIQNDVEIPDLGLVITDEQHRFGVEQRRRLSEKGKDCHVQVMSATPIPRTLALIIYGDLDVSIIDELPPGRMPIDTLKVDSGYHNRVYNFIKRQIHEGRQAYIICPLVEEGESDITPAVEYYEELAGGVFRNVDMGLLHGRMKNKEKDEIMQRFSSGEIKILVSTVVVEVGVDVPNATVMVIENAERFGLSQLHQLRGRIGRGQHKSYCILVSDAQNRVANERLDMLCSTNDGFKIADFDLEHRGPGDFFGSRQHGLPEMKLADFMTDTRILYAAKDIAEEIIEEDFGLQKRENLPLKIAVERLIKIEF